MTGKNPKTYVRRAGSSHNYFTFADGQDIKLKLKEILDIAQVDLDKRYENQTALPSSNVAALYGSGNDSARTPMTRLAGLRINAKFQYYNYNLHGKGDLGAPRRPALFWRLNHPSRGLRRVNPSLTAPTERILTTPSMRHRASRRATSTTCTPTVFSSTSRLPESSAV